MAAANTRISSDDVNCLVHSYFKDSGFEHSAFALRNEGNLKKSPNFSKHIQRGELVDLVSKALMFKEVEAHWRGDAITQNCKAPFSLLEPHVCSPLPPERKSVPTPAVPRAPPESASKQLKETPVPATPKEVPLPSKLSLAVEKLAISVKEPEQRKLPVEPKKPAVTKEAPATKAPAANGPLTSEFKRKGSPISAVDAPPEKRSRLGSDDMDIDSSSESTKTKPSPAPPVASGSNIVAEPLPKKVSKSKYRTQGPGDDTTDPRAILLLPGHRTEVFVCAWNPVKHNLLATGSKDAIVNLWNFPDPPRDPTEFALPPAQPLMLENFSKAEQGDLTSLHWNPEGSLLAIGSYDSVLRICTVTGEVYFSHPQHQGPIFAVRFSKSGKWLLTASLDGTTCLWDVKEKRLEKQYRSHTDCCLDVDWLSADMFASAGADERIHIMRTSEIEPVKTLTGHGSEINQIKVNPSGTRLASCSDDMTARIWRVDNIGNSSETIPGLVVSDQVMVLDGHKHSVSTISWCPNTAPGTNELLCTSSFDATARLWDSVTGECLKVFADHKRPVYALAFSPNGRWLATGSGDGWLYIYNTKTKERKWAWFAGQEKPGVFEVDWQTHNGVNRIALALECRSVAVMDIEKIVPLRNKVPPTPRRTTG